MPTKAELEKENAELTKKLSKLENSGNLEKRVSKLERAAVKYRILPDAKKGDLDNRVSEIENQFEAQGITE